MDFEELVKEQKRIEDDYKERLSHITGVRSQDYKILKGELETFLVNHFVVVKVQGYRHETYCRDRLENYGLYNKYYLVENVMIDYDGRLYFTVKIKGYEFPLYIEPEEVADIVTFETKEEAQLFLEVSN